MTTWEQPPRVYLEPEPSWLATEMEPPPIDHSELVCEKARYDREAPLMVLVLVGAGVATLTLAVLATIAIAMGWLS